MLCGDFNLIYQAADNNNGRLSQRMMGRFRHFLNDLELLELHLHGRLFTWSNERAHPTLERIDRVFVSPDLELLFPSSSLQAISSRCSDHSPLLLSLETCTQSKRRFTFQAFWPKVADFLNTVKAVWSVPRPDADPLRLIDHLLCETAKALVKWSAKPVGYIRMQIQVAKEVIFRLEVVHESRSLSPEELSLRHFLKLHYLGLTSLQRTIARQKSSLRWLREGDAYTKLFHLNANHRRRKNYIPSLLVDSRTLTHEDEKAAAAFTFFTEFWEFLTSALALLILRSSASRDWICRTSDNRSRRPKFGRSLKNYPWTRLLVPMGLLVASTGRAGRSSEETFFELLMLSPTWIVVASII
jgi:hypothetical protein